jgi:uncharacterized protein involved in exopolysaccharide biosynthesis
MSTTGRASVRDVPAEEAPKGAPEARLTAELIETEPSLLPYLQLFWASRRLLLRAGVCAFVVSAVIAFLIPVRFQSVTRLMPPDEQSGTGLGLLAAMAGHADTDAGGLGGLAGDLLGVKSSGALFVGILNSETAQDGLIQQFDLEKVYHDSKIEDARKDLAEHTDASEDRKSGIISIMVTDHDPKRAAAMAQAYVAELNTLVAQVSTSSARRERIFLGDRLTEVSANLETAEKNFSDFASKNTAIDIPAQGKAMVEAAATLQGQLIAAQAEMSGLRQIYTDNNARVRAVEGRVDELQKKLNELGGAGTQGAPASDNSLYPSIRKLPVLGVTYADLYRQTKVQEAVYETLTEQYELAKVQEAKEIPAVKVLDPAMVPTKKAFPPRTVITVLGTTIGIALVMTWIVGKTRWDAVDAGDPRKLFAMEVFGTLQAYAPRFPRNGTGPEANGHGTWSIPKKSETKDVEREGPERGAKN